MKMKMKFLPAVFLVPLFLWVNALAWEMPIKVKGGSGTSWTTYTLYFGTDAGATDLYDDGIDEKSPPAPPSGLDAHFFIGDPTPAYRRLTKDMRPVETLIHWTLKMAYPSPFDETDTITWNPADLPADGEFILDTLTQKIDMRIQSSAVYDLEQTLYIKYTGTGGNVWTVSGTVELSDVPAPGDWSGTTVTIGAYSDVTDANGDYSIPNVPEGTYDIVVTHTGYTPVTDNAVGVFTDRIKDYTLNPLEGFEMPIKVKGGSGTSWTTYTLYFGTDAGATDLYDDGIDEKSPPAPPSGLDAHFFIGDPTPAYRRLTKDMRPASDLIHWTLKMAYPSPFDETDTITWNPAELPANGEFILDTLTQKIDMRTQSSAVYDLEQTLYIKYSLIPPVKDVGGVAITSPPTAVYTDSTYPVTAKVANFGDATVSFDVGCIINGYGDTVNVANLAPNDTVDVTFAPDWIAPSTPGTVTMSVYTLLADDEDATNDTLTQEIIISPTPVKDVGAVEIVSPVGSIYPDTVYPVKAKVANFGNVTVSFDVVCVITDATPYTDTKNVANLAPNDTVDVNFTDWTGTSGAFEICVKTLLADDEVVTNDSLCSDVAVEETPVIPTTYELSRAVPNPVFNTVQISYAITEKGRVKINVYDITGKLVATLKNAIETPGRRSVTWDMKDTNHKKVHSGVYFYRMEAGKFLSVKKILVVK